MLSIVLPCFNERPNVLRFGAELLPALEALGEPYEILAVDDGSDDGTGEALRDLAGRAEALKILSHGRNRGLGAALRTAFAAARGERIATLDADLTFHPSQISALLERQRQTGADLVGGSPFLESGGMAGVPFARRLPSLMINAFYRGLFGLALTAYTPVFRLYRAQALKSLTLTSEGFEINAEIAARFLMAKKKVAEVPATLSTRKEGVSKLNRRRELKRHALLVLRLLSGR